MTPGGQKGVDLNQAASPPRQSLASANVRQEWDKTLLATSVISMKGAPPQLGSQGRKSCRIAPHRIASSVIVIMDLNQYSQPTA